MGLRHALPKGGSDKGFEERGLDLLGPGDPGGVLHKEALEPQAPGADRVSAI